MGCIQGGIIHILKHLMTKHFTFTLTDGLGVMFIVLYAALFIVETISEEYIIKLFSLLTKIN